MSRKSLKYSAMLFSILLATALTGCGTGNKEGGVFFAVPKVDEASCRVCHASSIDPVSVTQIVPEFLDSAHNTDAAGCQGCHGGGAQHNGVGPIPFPNPLNSDRCKQCHTNPPATGITTDFKANCTPCHSTGGPGTVGLHGAQVISATTFRKANDCIGCHDIPGPLHGTLVNDNNGVRAIVQEFSKWSHHVTGVNLQNAHCAACHLEGKAEGGAIVVDTTYHMKDAKTHLRNADTDADMQWDPAAPNHSTMDNFCMSCHDANGATSPQSTVIRAVMIPAAGKTASASNPFGDTISNRYDKMLRPAVVNVDSQFNTANNSHHGVKGPRYTGRTRTAGPRQIANPAAFAANSTATLWGKRSTIYDSVNAITGVKETANAAFNALYVPLGNAGGEAFPRTGSASLGDDSTLHCGDCHTVGQWKAGTAQYFNLDGTVDTTKVSPAIGAHGSNNEYMLRNSKGTDERHTQDAYLKNAAGNITIQNPSAAFLVCFNCHSYSRYGSVYNATGTTGPHAGEYDASGRCNGVGNTIPFNGYTTGTATDGTQFLSRIGEFTRAEASSTPAFAPGFPLNYANAPGGVQAATYTGEQNADFGNVFGIQCLNCHNSGLGNGYGGIHGSANNSPGTANTAAAGGYANPDPSVKGGAYVDGMGNTNKVQRFLPGLGNVMHVPGTLGGFTGGNTAIFNVYSSNGVNTGRTKYTFTTGAIASDTNWEQVGWRQGPGTTTAGPQVGAGCYTLNDEGTGSSLDDPQSAAYGIKGQSFDGNPASTPNAAKTWGGCDDHTGQGVGGGDHGFSKRINRPVTY